jgi:hypothetical protein
MKHIVEVRKYNMRLINVGTAQASLGAGSSTEAQLFTACLLVDVHRLQPRLGCQISSA